MLLSDVLCTGRGNHQVSPPPTGPSGCCCGEHFRCGLDKGIAFTKRGGGVHLQTPLLSPVRHVRPADKRSGRASGRLTLWNKAVSQELQDPVHSAAQNGGTVLLRPALARVHAVQEEEHAVRGQGWTIRRFVGALWGGGGVVRVKKSVVSCV